MNIELKSIAESKVRQLGGDVCGVLVRTDGGVMSVSEHGRCTRLDAGVMGPVDGAQGGEWLIQMRGEYLQTRGVWERPDHRGYTNDINEAGRYSEEEARKAEQMMPEKCKAVRLPTARAQGGQGAEVVDVTHFGKGELVVSRGKYGNNPAVFVSPVQNGPGVVGEHPGDREPDCDPYLRPGEWVMTFPTHEQAAWVCKALWNQLNTQLQPAVPEGWRECLAEMVQAMHDYEMSVEEDAPYKHRAMMERAHALLSTPTTPQADGCPECGSTDLTWHTQSSVTTGTQDGKLRANEVSTLFVLGCNHCSETIKILTADQVAENMSPQPPAGQEGES